MSSIWEWLNEDAGDHPVAVVEGKSVIRLLVLLLAIAMPSCLMAEDGTPRIVLAGKGESESGPHGEGNVYAPSVLLNDGKWRMWYGGQGKDGHDRIGYAESVDGKNWIRIGVVLEDETANHINDPSVVRVGDKFFMYFTRAEKFVIDRVCVATSTDGKQWMQHGVALDAGPETAWDSLSVGRPTVIHEDGMFKMWYDGRRDFPPGSPVEGVPISSDSHRYVGYATSKDGLNWQRHGDKPVFANDAGGIDVKRLGDNYIMLYESHGGTRCAKSRDGVRWKDVGWFVEKSGDDVDRHGHVTPFLMIEDTEQAWLFFGAAKAATWDRNCIAVVGIETEKLR